MRFWKKKNIRGGEIEPDEIFLDASNLPEFDTYQFEGRLERPISKHAVLFLGTFFVFVVVLFSIRLWVLQIQEWETFSAVAENNRLQNVLIFTERGVIFDRNENELAWNELSLTRDATSLNNISVERKYTKKDGFSHILGYVRYPKKDKKGFYYQEEFVGEEGVERSYNEILSGQNGLKLIEKDALGVVQSENTLRPPVLGDNIVLSIDSRIQEKLFSRIRDVANSRNFEGGAGVLIDVYTGEILALTNFPEYDSEILSSGKNFDAINAYRTNIYKPFLNRSVSGVYTPGSIVKPFVALAALEEGVITPEEKILSTGSISVPNPYFPDKESVFFDWKKHGWVNMQDALAVSSNVYFYEVGGGYNGQKGLGIERIYRYLSLFGFGSISGIDLFGEKKGLIPTPQWKEAIFNDEWRVGDTYNTAIGQYGFQVTPLQVARATAIIANGGRLLTPHVVYAIEKNRDKKYFGEAREVVAVRESTQNKLSISDGNFQVVRGGMRAAVERGSAKGLSVPYVEIAAKTGTAQVGITKERVNSWVTGFFPYKNPRFAFAVVMERGPSENIVGALFVMRSLFDWMAVETPEYLTTNDE